MSGLRDKRSIVGIDPTSYGLAYVAFENGELLDWGNLRRNGEGDELAMLDRIVNGVAADVLVVEDPDGDRCRRHPRIKKLLRDLARHARRRGIRVVPVHGNDVRQAWRRQGAKNKESMATEIAKELPELARFVPKARMYPSREDSRVNLFDAAALVLHAMSDGSDVVR